MTIHYQDECVTLHAGKAEEVITTLLTGSADCIVTSPPYFGLRDYAHLDQIGLEADPIEYVEKLRSVFAEARRVLADDGTLWLNLGDTYAHKNLLGIPWRVAFALQGDGWILRSDTIWHKPNGMPESTRSRPASNHEHVFMFVKKPRGVWFDLDAIRVPLVDPTRVGHTFGGNKNTGKTGRDGIQHQYREPNPLGRNPGNVWSISASPFPHAHFATMPPKLAHRLVVSGCKPGGVVLDPYCGVGTSGMVAVTTGRRFVGIDLIPETLDLALQTRLKRSSQ